MAKKNAQAEPPDQLILDMGKFFLGTPYAAGTLKTRDSERLIVNLREFDCVTFVESVIALARLVKSRRTSFETFRRTLLKIRYRHGRLQGYPSRLHYFTDWIHDNQKKAIVTDITAEIGGTPLRKTVNFMTRNPGLYLPLRDMENLRRMKAVERRISRRSLFIIPTKFVRRQEDRMQDGDVIAILTKAEGLDAHHVGFAVRMKGRVHLLHASSLEGKVVLSRQTLYRYLMRNKVRSGIMVARVL
jgi:hypothetical protein